MIVINDPEFSENQGMIECLCDQYDGQMLTLDKHRMVSNRNQIGRRYWNEKWRDWSYEVLNVEPGLDVTGFIDENGG